MDMIAMRTCHETRNCSAYFGAAISQRQLYLLDKFEHITIIPDNDAAGMSTLRRLLNSSIAHKTSVLFPPNGCKDANDILLKKCPNASSVEEAVKRGWLTKAAPLQSVDIANHPYPGKEH
jgi:DNA primase